MRLGIDLHPGRQDELLQGLVGRSLGEVALVDEPVQHLDPPGTAPFRCVDRIESGRRADEAGEERRFEERQLVGGLAEVRLGRGLDAVGVVAEEHRVEVALEDLLLRHLPFEHAGVVDLQQLVATVAFESRQEVVLDDLHRDRRGTLLRRVGGEVRQGGAHEAAHVHAVVAEELLVLHQQEGLDHRFGDVGVLDRLGVLEFVHGDLVAVGVVHVRPLRQRLERRKRHREFVVGVGGRPDARRDTDDHRRHQQGTTGDDERQSRDPAERAHNAEHATGGPSPIGGSPPLPEKCLESRAWRTVAGPVRLARRRWAVLGRNSLTSCTIPGIFQMPTERRSVGTVSRRDLGLPATTVPLRCPTLRCTDTSGVGRRGPTHRGPRLRRGQHA